MSKYLFLFSIGPVQSFIAQARKTQDLRAGSKLLSDLIDFAITKIEKHKSDLIFPNKDIDSKPNRMLVKVEFDSDEELTEFSEELEQKVKAEFKNICNKNYPKDKTMDNFDTQVDNFLETNWAALPLSENYAQTYSDLERFFASVKNAKAFNQNPPSENGRKCSLCGERNGLFYCQSKPYKTQKDAVKFYDGNKGETLCAICFTKRNYDKRNMFPSTAEICLNKHFGTIVNELDLEDKAKLETIKKEDSQLFFEDKLTKEQFAKEYSRFTDFELIKEMIQKFQDKSKNLHIKISKYYALLMFDGDKMGDWLSGVNLPDKSRLEGFHKAFSQKLGEYAKWAEGYVNSDNRGKAVYAGGDDFLGFLNLDSMLETVKELRYVFDKQINQPLKKEFILKKNITFSAGITIAHFKSPLHFVLQKTRDMEKKAKEVGKRNAFAICVMKHSGEILESVMKWNQDGFRISLLQQILEELISERFSTSFLLNYQKEFKLTDYNSLSNESETEMKRLMKNSCNLLKEEKIEKVDELFKQIHPFLLDENKDFSYVAPKPIFNILCFLNKEHFKIDRGGKDEN